MSYARTFVLCATVVLVAASSAAAAQWSKPQRLVDEPGTDPVTLRIAMDSGGRAAFVWIHGKLIETRMRGAEGRLGRIVVLRRMPHGNMGLPQIAMGPRRQVAVLWLERATGRSGGSKGYVYAAVGSGGRFGRPVRVGISKTWPQGGTGAGAQGDSPKVAIAPNGTVGALWLYDSGSLRASFRRPGHSFGAPETIASRFPGQISLGFDGRNVAYAAWASAGAHVATRGPRAAHFGPADVVSTAGQVVSKLQMAVGVDATVALVWVDADPFLFDTAPVQATLKPPGQSFPAAQTLTPPGCTGDGPNLAVSARGPALATWAQYCRSDPTSVVGARLDVPPVPELLPASVGTYRDLAIADSGAAVFVYSPGARASLRPAAGHFDQGQLIARSAYSTTPRVAIGGRLAITSWQAPGGFYYSTLRLPGT